MPKPQDRSPSITSRRARSDTAQPPRSTRKSTEYILSMLLIFGGAFGIGTVLPSAFQTNPSIQSRVAGVSAETPKDSPALNRSLPISLSIPDIGLRADIVSVRTTAEGELVAPDDDTKAGWYVGSPTPGELGPAIITGHVDNYLGPAVFFNLRDMEPGQVIEVERADGTTATFEVNTIQEFTQNNFPTDQVYGNIDHAGLRLITCSGTYSPLTTHYSHNIVIFASLPE